MITNNINYIMYKEEVFSMNNIPNRQPMNHCPTNQRIGELWELNILIFLELGKIKQKGVPCLFSFNCCFLRLVNGPSYHVTNKFHLFIMHILNACMTATTFFSTIAFWFVQVMLIPVKSIIHPIMFSNKIMQNTSSNYNVSLVLNVIRWLLLQNFLSILPHFKSSLNHSSKWWVNIVKPLF